MSSFIDCSSCFGHLYATTGLCSASPEFAEVGSGFVTAIDDTTGALTVNAGVKVQLNDPKGTYSAGQSFDPLWTVDTGM